MKNKKIIAIIAAVGILGSATVITALAEGINAHKITCPSCGEEIEMPKPEYGDKRGKGEMTPKSPEEMKTELDEKVSAGELTQEEADAMLAKWEERLAEMEEKMAERKAEQEERDDLDENAKAQLGGRPFRPMKGKGGGMRMLPEIENTEE